MVRSGICFYSLIFLSVVCQTPMLIYALMLELVLRLIKALDVKAIAHAMLVQIVNRSDMLVPCVICPHPFSSSVVEFYPMT